MWNRGSFASDTTIGASLISISILIKCFVHILHASTLSTKSIFSEEKGNITHFV